ncbi:GTP binding protein 6 (putative) (predicted), isoform CRA_c [Rattus norvegicus]|uniref:GTP binding protein 6 (Putative) (Predicted), isoform CRA_c n=1 Tax=Rattus norvegicus TaxID=10116 RepID=A6J2D8_RAT|nr:GTP binding protein 6 (putative) (predicted), isoform CRA_c [Rattus norvegicus]
MEASEPIPTQNCRKPRSCPHCGAWVCALHCWSLPWRFTARWTWCLGTPRHALEPWRYLQSQGVGWTS